MNLGEFTELALLLAGVFSLPILAYSINIDDSNYSNLITNTTSSLYTIEKIIGNDFFEYRYKTEYGEMFVKIGNNEIYSELSKIGGKTSLKANYTCEIARFESPGRTLVKIFTPDYIYSEFKMPGNVLIVNITPFGNITEFKGSGNPEDIRRIYEETEKRLERNLNILKNFTEDVTGNRKVEISYLKCSGSVDEFVEIRNNRLVKVSLYGWKIKDEEGNVKEYEINGVVLSPGESIRLYRNQTDITWNDTGDKAILLDPEGNIVSERSCDE